ncbi:MAG: hypothetical protein KJP23_16450 [Deltaproteobacteria bacterium]|nr:hypothetical protein [Deltaproteobacteria bacterium]
MKQIIFFALIFFFSIFLASPLFAQDPIIYPAEGQSRDQQERDEFECFRWARDQTGFDPMATPTATSAPPQQEAQRGGAGRGAVAGAATGAIVGGIASGRSGAGRGALIGGGGGALFGGMRRNNQRKEEDQARNQWEREQANNYARARDEYNRAFGACMSGRGYTVK